MLSSFQGLLGIEGDLLWVVLHCCCIGFWYDARQDTLLWDQGNGCGGFQIGIVFFVWWSLGGRGWGFPMGEKRKHCVRHGGTRGIQCLSTVGYMNEDTNSRKKCYNSGFTHAVVVYIYTGGCVLYK